MNYNDEASLVSCLDLWSRFLDSERDMLHRRICLLMEYEAANRNLEKSRGNKREEVSSVFSSFPSSFYLCVALTTDFVMTQFMTWCYIWRNLNFDDLQILLHLARFACLKYHEKLSNVRLPNKQHDTRLRYTSETKQDTFIHFWIPSMREDKKIAWDIPSLKFTNSIQPRQSRKR